MLDPFPLYSARRRAPARFRRADYLGDPARPLDECARDAVEAADRRAAPAGPVRLLTGLRYLGHTFNPVSFYYCFDPTGRAGGSCRRRGREHTLGGATRLRAGTGRRARAQCWPTSSRRNTTSRP